MRINSVMQSTLDPGSLPLCSEDTLQRNSLGDSPGFAQFAFEFNHCYFQTCSNQREREVNGTSLPVCALGRTENPLHLAASMTTSTQAGAKRNKFIIKNPEVGGK